MKRYTASLQNQEKKPWWHDYRPEIITLGCLIVFILTIVGINILPSKTIEPVSAFVEDSIRHYPPIVRGDRLYISCKVVNMDEDNPLVITDIQPGNFAIELLSTEKIIIRPKHSEIVNFIYYSEKVIGKVEQKIRMYGNIKKTGMLELTFDTHVVRPAGDQSDYEDIYFQEKQKLNETLVDGELGQKGYTPDYGAHQVSMQRNMQLQNEKSTFKQVISKIEAWINNTISEIQSDRP